MKPFKICCITYKLLDRLVKETLAGYSDPELEIVIVEGLQEEIEKGLKEAEGAGCEIAIAGGANALIARKLADIPVIEYRLTAYDYFDALESAQELGDKIAICTYLSPIDGGLRGYLQRRHIDFENIIYDADTDLRRSIEAHPDCVIIGAAHAVDIAEKLGYKSVSIYPGQNAVLSALREAKDLAEQLRRQSERSKFSQAIVDNSTNGIVLVDSEWSVLDFNTAAQEIFGLQPTAVKGRDARKVLPKSGVIEFSAQQDYELTQVRTVRNEDVFCKWVHLTSRAMEKIGAVGIFASMPDILKAQVEHQKRQFAELADRGFSAKMRLPDAIGSSPAVAKAKEDALLFATSDASIVIQGETGVGKEVFAQGIHNASKRRHGPFIAINCAALPENLLESELFGYDEGAFTGGKRGGKKGLFEYAHTGSIFLDEIGELPPSLQSRLLRVLQEKEIMHVGGERVIPVDVRVIAATNRDLERTPHEQFRKDLYYRLSVLNLGLPPLRERGNDARELFLHFLKSKASLTIRPTTIPEEVLAIIALYRWPGNIRELQNVCERYCLYLENTSQRGVKVLQRSLVRAIGEERLLQSLFTTHNFPREKPSRELAATLQNVLGYNKGKAAEVLGMSRTTLWRQGG